MNVLTCIKKGRRLLTNPKRWAQGSQARDKRGRSAMAYEKNAYSFCAVGASLKYAPKDASIEFQAAILHALDAGVRGGNIVDYNDVKGRKHEQILKAYDRAIAKLEASK